MTTTAMMRTTAAAVVAVAALLAPLTACSRNDAPAPDATGPVEATSIQDTPQDLLVGVLRLREKGHPEDAARYFISRDAYRDWNDLKTLDEVDASALCTSSSADCTDVYSKYSNGKRCSETTSQEAQEAGVIDNRTGRPVNTNPDKPNDRLVNAKVAGTGEADNCRFSMAQVGGKWWFVNG